MQDTNNFDDDLTKVLNALLDSFSLSSDSKNGKADEAFDRCKKIAVLLLKHHKAELLVKAVEQITLGYWSPGGKFFGYANGAVISPRFMPSVADIMIVCKRIPYAREN